MGERGAILLLTMLLSARCLTAVVSREPPEMQEEEWKEAPMGHRGRKSSERPFIMDKTEKVVKTEAGEVRVVGKSSSDTDYPWGWGSPAPASPISVGFISMEPKTLFVPQYLDSSLILFVRRGEARVGWIYKDEMVEKQLKMGDLIYIEAGSTFYIVNTGKGQRLHIICSIESSKSSSSSLYQPFFIGGGMHPSSVLAGFSVSTLTAAFNVTPEEIHTILESQNMGPIIYTTSEAAEPGDHGGKRGGDRRKKDLLNSLFDGQEKDDEVQQEERKAWTWRKLLGNILGGNTINGDRRRGKKDDDHPVQSPDPYNLYDRDPDFRNDYGWTIALDEDDYADLKRSDMGVYLVNLTAGSMLAPHFNPRAAEYGVVIGGAGTIEVVFPNGTSAMIAEVSEGDVFWIPRFFPFCQIASRSGPLEFFGFTTSAKRNLPQFLAGNWSVLTAMMGPELAAGFGVPEKELRSLLRGQREAVIVPPWPLPEREEEREKKGRSEGEKREDGSEQLLMTKKVMDF